MVATDGLAAVSLFANHPDLNGSAELQMLVAGLAASIALRFLLDLFAVWDPLANRAKQSERWPQQHQDSDYGRSRPSNEQGYPDGMHPH